MYDTEVIAPLNPSRKDIEIFSKILSWTSPKNAAQNVEGALSDIVFVR